jgi:hypothetical protein
MDVLLPIEVLFLSPFNLTYEDFFVERTRRGKSMRCDNVLRKHFFRDFIVSTCLEGADCLSRQMNYEDLTTL